MKPEELRVKVLNRKQALKLKYKPATGTKACMVSVNSVGKSYSSMPVAKGDVRGVLYLNFDDVTDETDGVLFTEKDAMQVKDFVLNCLKAGMELLYVHCDAGVSRSAALAKALQDFYNLPEENVEYRTGTCPNPHVYEVMTKALES